MAPTPIKILHVVFTLEMGGMENGLVNVANRLPKDEFDVHVCCLERSGPFAARLPEPGNVTVLDKPSGISLRTIARLSGLVGRLQPHVVHTHGYGSLIYGALATGLGTRAPILHGEHGMMYPSERTRLHLLMRRFLYSRCRRIHSVSHGLKEHFVEFGLPAARIEVIVNGVDTERFFPADKADARRKLGLPVNARLVGIVGSYSERKRHALLFEAFDMLAREWPDAALLVVGGGTGPYSQKVAELARTREAAARIHLAGFQDNPVPYYQAMDLLVVPSVNEGLSNAALEAMACGVPALAHNACGNADIIKNGMDGFVSNIETGQQLYQQMKLILSDRPHVESMGQAARLKVTSLFSLGRMAKEYEQMYRQLASK